MHLFAGAGGGLLADLILRHTPVVAVEWDRYCCQVLRERALDGWFPGLHVYEGDVRLFDPSDYAGRVDCLSAGFPCQDISLAGNRAGIAEGTRSGLWSEVVRVARIVRPQYLFLENVAAIVNLGLDTVLADIAGLGFDAQWICLRASDAGAPHRRDRWWLVADADARGLRGARAVHSKRQIGPTTCSSADVADADFFRFQGGAQSAGYGGERPESDNEQSGKRDQRYRADAVRVSQWGIEPDVGRVAHGVAARVDRLKALGNGQVPAQAALAWRILTG